MCGDWWSGMVWRRKRMKPGRAWPAPPIPAPTAVPGSTRDLNRSKGPGSSPGLRRIIRTIALKPPFPLQKTCPIPPPSGEGWGGGRPKYRTTTTPLPQPLPTKGEGEAPRYKPLTTQGSARTEGGVQSARPVGAVQALPGQRDRAVLGVGTASRAGFTPPLPAP